MEEKIDRMVSDIDAHQARMDQQRTIFIAIMFLCYLVVSAALCINSYREVKKHEAAIVDTTIEIKSPYLNRGK